MAEEVLAIEARLKDYISGSLATLENNIKKFSGMASDGMATAEKSSNAFGGSITSLAARFIPFLTVAGAATTAVKLFRDAVGRADALDKLSRQTGESTDNLQRMQYVIRQTDGDVGSMAMAFKNFSIKQYEARQGSKEAIGIFSDLGLNIKDHNVSVQEAMLALAGMANQDEKTALAQKLFGRAALDLLPTLNSSKDALQKYNDEAERNGQVMSKDAIEGLDKMKHGWENLGTAIANATGEFVYWLAKNKNVYQSDEMRLRMSQFSGELGGAWGGEQKQKKGVGPVKVGPSKGELEAQQKAADAAQKTRDQAFDERWSVEDHSMELQAMYHNADLEDTKNYNANKKKLEDEALSAHEQHIKDWDDAEARGRALDKHAKNMLTQYGNQFANSMNAMLEQGIRNSKEAGQKKKAQLIALATMETAAMAVTGAMGAFNEVGGGWQGVASAILVAGAAIAEGAVQISTISSQSFARGTRSAPGGQSLVGEAGAELVLGPRMGYLPPGSTVFNNSETSNLFNTKTEIFHFYDKSGALVDTLRREIRSGGGQDLIADLKLRI